MDAWVDAVLLSSQAPTDTQPPPARSFTLSPGTLLRGWAPLPGVPGVSAARPEPEHQSVWGGPGLPGAAVAEPGIIQRCPGMPPPTTAFTSPFLHSGVLGSLIIRIKVLSQWHSPPCPVLPVIQRRKTGSPEPRAQRLVPVCRQNPDTPRRSAPTASYRAGPGVYTELASRPLVRLFLA